MLKAPQRKLSSSRDLGFGASGSAAQRQAIDSLKAIANVTLAPGKDNAAQLKPDEAAIVALLRDQQGQPAPAISAVAERLAWPSGRVAEALSGASQAGLVRFLEGPGGTTLVEPTQI